MLVEKLRALNKYSSRNDLYQNNVDLIRGAIAGSTPLTIAPRFGSVFPIYIYGTHATLCIVLELRKNNLTLNQNIEKFLTGNPGVMPKIWL